MIVPIKAGAEALDRTDDLAQAWLYATDIGADVIVSVTADIGYSSFMRQAVEYASHHGVVAVQASNDFDSTDHQGGMWWPHVLPGQRAGHRHAADPGGHPRHPHVSRSIRAHLVGNAQHVHRGRERRFDERSPPRPSVASRPCSFPTGRPRQRKDLIRQPLSNFEAIQVLRATSSDVADPSLPWPGKPGWDLQYGYGRPNLWKAMKAVSEGEIPPVGTIESPGWFTVYDPTVTHRLRVSGHVEARRSGSYRWELQMGMGPEPADGDFKVIGRGSGHSPRDLTLGSIDLRSIPAAFASAAFGLSNDKALSTSERYTVTLRLRVTDGKGRMGEDRRSIFVRHDDSLVRGFPRHIGPDLSSQPALADLNGDGRLEIVFGDADGRVHAVDARTRRELKGWPVLTNAVRVVRSHPGVHPGHEPVVSNVAVGDLDHTGRLSVVATSTEGRVYIWDAHGRRRAGWPKVLSTGVRATPIPRPDLPYTRLPVVGATAHPVLFDMNGDRRLEVIQSGWDGHLHVWKGDGSNLTGWPVKVQLPSSYQPSPGHFLINDHKVIVPPAVADLDGDGEPELVVRSQWSDVIGPDIQPGGIGHVHAYHADGSLVPGWPNSMLGVVEYYGSAQEFVTEGSNAPVAANVDGLGGDEIAAAPVFSPGYLFGGDGRLRAVYGPVPDVTLGLGSGQDPLDILQRSLPADVTVNFTTSGAFGRFGPLGTLTYAEPGSGGASIIGGVVTAGTGIQLKNYLRAWDALTGVNHPGFPAVQQGLNFLGSPVFADVTGDGRAEILDGGDSSALHAYTLLGAQARGFPKFTTGWSLFSPTVGDLDGDGRVEVVQGTREGYLYVWRTPGLDSGNTEWWRNRHDEWNTANYGTDARPPAAVTAARWNGVTGVLRFMAPGDDWQSGMVSRYRIEVDGRWVSRRAGVAAGILQTFRLGGRPTAIQAVDDAGNVGPILRIE